MNTQLEYAQFIFHGTGSSGSMPHIECLTAPEGREPCIACLSTLRPEGKRNVRRNTGAVLQVNRPDGEKATIVIDVGKNFLESALEWFPKYGLRKIDGVLITHPHADAMNGLDDLRGWTLEAAIQSHIDIYTSQQTFTQVQRAFPYLVSKEFASGGGDVPQFRWHIIEPNRPFVVEGTNIEFTPFTVHHGRYFTNGLPLQGWLPTPEPSLPPTPKSAPSTPIQADTLLPSNSVELIRPYECLGFIFLDIVYMSDVSHIPETTWEVIESRKKRPYSIFVVDCLRVAPHTSHFGLAQAIEAARRLGGNELHTYLVGISHELPHSTWVDVGKVLAHPEYDLNALADNATTSALEHVPKGASLWVRPAYDGLRVCLDADGKVHLPEGDD